VSILRKKQPHVVIFPHKYKHTLTHKQTNKQMEDINGWNEGINRRQTKTFQRLQNRNIQDKPIFLTLLIFTWKILLTNIHTHTQTNTQSEQEIV